MSATGRFAGRRALVTGASRGIGVGVAERLAAEGADVALVARTLEQHPTLPGSLQAAARRLEPYGHRVVPVVADLSDPAAVERVVPEATAGLGGPIDILVNNAAAAIYQPLADYPARRLRLTLAVNLEAPFALMQAVIPAMRSAGEGWIVNLSSATARLQAPPPARGINPAMGVYGASKAALNRLTNALAAEVFVDGIRINTVEPRAGVLTEGAEALLPDGLAAHQLESLEAMVEATVALCAGPPELTGQVLVSLDLLATHQLEGRALSGAALAPDPPA